MKRYLFILILGLLSNNRTYSQVGDNPTYCADNYGFSVVIDMQHLQHDNAYNYKFLINERWSHNENDSSIFFNDIYDRFIKYNYVAAPQKGFDRYDRIPADTIKFKLSNEQMDSIYFLTSNLFQLDSSINVKNTNSNADSYDGEYVTIKLHLINYSTAMHTTIDFSEDKIFQKRFIKLIEYMDKIKNAL
jgi:hypothetical protein